MGFLSDLWDAGTDAIGDLTGLGGFADLANLAINPVSGGFANLAGIDPGQHLAFNALGGAAALGAGGAFGPIWGGAAGGGAAAGSATTGGGGFGSWLPGILGIGQGLFGMNQARKLGKLNADPFGPYRDQYAQQLAQLQADPSSITNIPGYKFGLDQGLIGRQRALASGGYSGSGNELIGLEQYAQDYAGRYYSNEVARLAGLAGADIRPNFQPQFDSAALYRKSIGDISGGLGDIFARRQIEGVA